QVAQSESHGQSYAQKACAAEKIRSRIILVHEFPSDGIEHISDRASPLSAFACWTRELSIKRTCLSGTPRDRMEYNSEAINYFGSLKRSFFWHLSIRPRIHRGSGLLSLPRSMFYVPFRVPQRPSCPKHGATEECRQLPASYQLQG